MSRSWDVAIFFPLVVFVAGVRIAGVRIVEFGSNTAARLVLGLDRHCSITSALRKLHWLPVHYRISFKVATLMYDVFHQLTDSTHLSY